MERKGRTRNSEGSRARRDERRGAKKKGRGPGGEEGLYRERRRKAEGEGRIGQGREGLYKGGRGRREANEAKGKKIRDSREVNRR